MIFINYFPKAPWKSLGMFPFCEHHARSDHCPGGQLAEPLNFIWVKQHTFRLIPLPNSDQYTPRFLTPRYWFPCFQSLYQVQMHCAWGAIAQVLICVALETPAFSLWETNCPTYLLAIDHPASMHFTVWHGSIDFHIPFSRNNLWEPPFSRSYKVKQILLFSAILPGTSAWPFSLKESTASGGSRVWDVPSAKHVPYGHCPGGHLSHPIAPSGDFIFPSSEEIVRERFARVLN